jgi:putative monooxygenase
MLPVITTADLPTDTRRGGEIRTVLSPRTVGCTSGFMGLARLAPGESIAEHYHPYSEEFLYVTAGTVEVRVDGEPHEVAAGQGLVLPINARHRLANRGRKPVELVFHCGPLAPRPELGHVDTEPSPRQADSGAAAADELAEDNVLSAFWWSLLHVGAAMGYAGFIPPGGVRRAPRPQARRSWLRRRRSALRATAS